MARHPAERPPAATLAQLARRIDLDVTTPDFLQQGRTRTDPPSGKVRRERRPVGPSTPAQPKDFKGLLPPAAPPPPATATISQPPMPRRYGSGPYQPPSRQPGPRQPGPQQRGPQQPGPYGPTSQHRPGPHHPPGKQDRPKPYGWYRVLSLLLLASTLALAAMLPAVTLAVVLVALLLLRMGDRAARDMESKRTRRGPSSGDVIAAVLKSPFALPRALLTTLFVSPIGAMAAAIVLLFLVVARPGMTVPQAIAVSVAAFILVLCLGPGSESIRRQLARTWGVVAPRHEHAIVLAICLGLLAAFLITLAPTQAPDLRPVNFSWMTGSLEHLRDLLRDLFGSG
jgi:hypothetical protein